MIHLNDHFIFKTIRLFVSNKFLVSHPRLCKPRHFYRLSPLGTMSDHNWQFFTREGDLSLLDNTRHIFFFTTLFNRSTLLDVVPFNRAFHNQTPNAMSIHQPYTHTHLIRFPCAYAMQYAIASYIMSNA